MSAKRRVGTFSFQTLLGVNLRRSSLRGLFAVVGAACAMSILTYFYWVSSMQRYTGIVPDSPLRTLWGGKSLRRYTELSKNELPETTDHSVSTQNIQSFTGLSEHSQVYNVTEAPANTTIIHQHPDKRPMARLGETTSHPSLQTPSPPSSLSSPSPSSLSPHPPITAALPTIDSRLNPHPRPKIRRPPLFPHILVLVGQGLSPSASHLRTFLEAQRLAFLMLTAPKGLALLALSATHWQGRLTVPNLSRLSVLLVLASPLEYQRIVLRVGLFRARHLPLVWLAVSTTGTIANQTGAIHCRSSSSSSAIALEVSSSYPFHYCRPGARTERLTANFTWTSFSVYSHDSHVISGTDRRSAGGQDLNSNAQPGVGKMTPPFFNPRGQLVAHDNYRTLVEITSLHGNGLLTDLNYITEAAAIEDTGKFDYVRKIFIGLPIKFWLAKLLLLDALYQLCGGGRLGMMGRERWMMVDIDDVFVAPEGRRMTGEDVQALLSFQSWARTLVPGFTFNLGFVGGYYERGREEEVRGNRELVRNAAQFWWFGHTYLHQQPHHLNLEELREAMSRNRDFAVNHSIPAFTNGYSVSPHHSGVYPVYGPLYKIWKAVWNVSVVTTEEYPHLRPDHLRRGFIYRGIRVLPRQTCRLFTKTWLFDQFRGGQKEVVNFAEGGEVFNTLLNNPISVFMTHTPNYCCDRLSLLLFHSLFSFLSRWTQFSLSCLPPPRLADKYFELFPSEKNPVWTSPCDDRRHLEIWPSSLTCSLPSLLILGPQKSGSTALHSFLKLHPLLKTNSQTQTHFEEIQFFSDDSLYYRGIEWYMELFHNSSTPSSSASLAPPSPVNTTTSPSSPSSLFTSSSSTASSLPIFFEKSATYLTHLLSPVRAFSLLPRAKLIIILSEPGKRAYSWYQHQRVHNDPTAMEYSFSQVLRANENSTSSSSPPLLSSLSHHCLYPGHYFQHVSKWLEYYSTEQLLLVDGGQLVNSPSVVMKTVQSFLGVDPVDYNSLLQFNSHKGFYCMVKGKSTKCLGRSKGRSYPPMTPEDRKWLDRYYAPHNSKLAELLLQLERRPPDWLVAAEGILKSWGQLGKQ